MSVKISSSTCLGRPALHTVTHHSELLAALGSCSPHSTWDMDNNCNIALPALKTEALTASEISTNPAGGTMGVPTKEMCSGCQRPIEDRFLLRVMDNSWHEHCLQCSLCQEPLSHSCFVKDRKLFCKRDYDKLYGARCSGCMQSIPANELVMRALGHVYHLNCFLCVMCGYQLQKGDQFVLKDGQIFCRMDFEKECARMHLSPLCQPYSPKSDEDSSIDENDLDQPKGPKRPRTILTTSQRRKFKASFEVNPKPCRKVRETLAAETGLSVRVVQVWFQNQRAKVKKIERRQTQDDGSKKGDGTESGKKQSKKPKKEDHDSSGSSTQGDNMPALAPSIDNPTSQHYSNQLTPFNSNNSQGVYSSSSVSDGMYEGNMSIDGNLDNLDDMLMNQSASQTSATSNGPGSSAINPIDKLYSMQSSYFTAE